MTLIDLGTGGAAEPASLADIKSFCRIDRADEDGLILRLARAARGAIEARTGVALVRRAFRLCLDPAPRDRWVRLPRRPFDAVLSVTAYDAAGLPVVHAGASGLEARSAGGEAVRLTASAVASAANGVEVEFRAGFAPEEVPADLYLALLQTIAAAYEMRGGVDPAMQPAALPASARALMEPFRAGRLL